MRFVISLRLALTVQILEALVNGQAVHVKTIQALNLETGTTITNHVQIT